MARLILQQASGKYCVWSTIVDDIICYDMDESDVYNFFREEAIKKSDYEVGGILGKLLVGKNPYGSFAISQEQIEERIKANAERR